MRAALMVSMCCVSLGACTTIKLNEDNTTITHKEGEGVAEDLATRACHRAGEQRAVIISTVNKDPSKPEGTGRQVTTFRCTSQQPQTPSQ